MTEPSAYVLEPLREGADVTLYRGRQLGNPSPVLVVALTAEQPSPQGLRRLEHEYSLAAELDPAWAARPLALTRHEGRTILILTDPGGEPLDVVLERDRGEPLDLTRVLRIAIGLATALGQMHRHGLIHKDIKPANVLVDDAGNVWLTGFGISSRLPRERQAPAPPEIIAGTLAYMAPEQTGRMNRSIDARSDLYSLGVSLYQMLTGRLPFAAADALEWVHCHIARQPAPLDGSAKLPAPLSAIIMRLLAKTVEDRYQTAVGLEADLRRCLAEWESQGRIDPFPLGPYDVSDQLLIPERLYGREREIDALIAAFDRVVAQGTPELVLVSGYSGVGKSSVVNELHKVLVAPRGLFASGKFDQYKRDIPYATLAQAFQSLIRSLLGQSEEELGRWREALREALGRDGQLIVNLVHELELVIGKQPPVPDLPPHDAQNRFQMVFRRFLGVFARKEHPLALFLDDLQWLDTATLDLLEHLVTHTEVRHLLLVGAYRDNEVGPAHQLLRTLDAIRGANASVHEIVLAPLGLGDVDRLIADALHCELERARPLAQLVHEKTGGNPFFAIQFLTALAEEGLLGFDPHAAAWIWDLARIRAKGYTDNVVDLMVGKLKRLSGATQTALQQLACLGNVVEIARLGLVFGESEEEIHAALLEAARTGLILRLEGAYAFLHDRIQEAAYTLIPESERAAAHLRIGRELLANMTTDELGEHLFDVANQFNRGAARLVDRDEKARVATIDLRAGRKAKASTAYAPVCAYFAAGMDLFDESDWDRQYELMFSLWLERAECEFLSGDFDKAGQLITELLQRGTSKVDVAAAYRLKVQLQIVSGNQPQAVESALACLRLFGIEFPDRPTREQVQAEYETVWRNLDGRPIESLIDLPLMTDPELQAAMRVLRWLSEAAYGTDLQLFRLFLCRIVNIGMLHGTSSPFAHALGFFGTLLAPEFHRYSEGYRFTRAAYELVEKHGLIADKASTCLAMGMVSCFTRPIETARDFCLAAVRSATEAGNVSMACYTMMVTVFVLFLRDDPLDAVWRELEMGLDFARKSGFRDVADIFLSQQRFIATMQGRSATFSTFSDTQFDEAAFEAQLTGDRMPLMISLYWILKLKARFLSGDYAEALTAADKVKAFLWAMSGQVQLVDYFFYAALTVAACYQNSSADEQEGWRELLTAHREQLREWAENYPPTFADKHALVSAEIARLDGRDLDAMRLYEQAIQSAHENGFVQNEALAHEVAARFYLAGGFETIAHTYLRNARNCYDRWGALGKVKQLDEHYPHLHEERDSGSPTATIGTPGEHLDLATVVKVSQTVSGEIVLKKLIDTLMVTALQHAGAERGLLILVRGDQMQIEAEATTDRDTIAVRLLSKVPTSSELPDSVFQYVLRTQEAVIIDDASAHGEFSADPYFVGASARSILCLPLVKQATLTGVLYLENSLASHVFTPARIAVLRLLASQAAISLENAHLYTELHEAQAYLSEAQRLSQTGSAGWVPSTGEIIWSSETYRIFDFDPAIQPTEEMVLERIHPEDRSLFLQITDQASRAGQDWNLDHRLLMPDGSVKYLHVVSHAVKNDSRGEVGFVGAVMDVTAAKQSQQALEQAFREIKTLKDQLQSENIVLREEIDKASMFEQIVGTSPPLRNVLSRVSKVAPTDSSVLITGETGTGKELVARAIHRRSQRSPRAFVSVNCAAIPHDLIASELFGHEKGAFTGATQRRLGRFEMAEGGTIFLDEVGELPSETQIALLRVLQEHEFERVGGTGSIQNDVRVIAATNRDLEAAIAAGKFRSDLFYRLNVFPIEMPSLRERKEDIPLLVEYFIDRFARQAGKSFQALNKKSLDLLQSYPWPGNIRELQNVIERSVIVCETKNFSVDESWLSRQPRSTGPKSQLELSQKLASQEKEMIEAVLSESGGRVFGPAGAATKLGMPRSTLESKIRSLKIDKKRFKTSDPSQSN
ncbi:MAG: multi-sensor signal transduction multi-kinase [Bryobacterales bacterium]|nr:multi-sensor signal transduction multi-kinase [Bryobacterales bacterium]